MVFKAREEQPVLEVFWDLAEHQMDSASRGRVREAAEESGVTAGHPLAPALLVTVDQAVELVEFSPVERRTVTVSGERAPEPATGLQAREELPMVMASPVRAVLQMGTEWSAPEPETARAWWGPAAPITDKAFGELVVLRTGKAL